MTDELASSAGDDLPEFTPNLWWALYRPETYALSSLVLAVSVWIASAPIGEFLSLVFFDTGESFRNVYGTTAAIRLALALLAIGMAVTSIRSEDEDTTWSPPVARTALIIASIGALFAIATLIAWLASTPHVAGFTSPSP
jgi:1,4-dihydroxy-2-naphthoate octaprenyltransferase